MLGIKAFLVFKKGPDLSPYVALKEPRISRRESEGVLEVEFSGPADTATEKRLNEFMAHAWTGSVAIPIPEGLIVADRRPGAEGMVARGDDSNARFERPRPRSHSHAGTYLEAPASGI